MRRSTLAISLCLACACAASSKAPSAILAGRSRGAAAGGGARPQRAGGRRGGRSDADRFGAEARPGDRRDLPRRPGAVPRRRLLARRRRIRRRRPAARAVLGDAGLRDPRAVPPRPAFGQEWRRPEGLGGSRPGPRVSHRVAALDRRARRSSRRQARRSEARGGGALLRRVHRGLARRRDDCGAEGREGVGAEDAELRRPAAESVPPSVAPRRRYPRLDRELVGGGGASAPRRHGLARRRPQRKGSLVAARRVSQVPAGRQVLSLPSRREPPVVHRPLCRAGGDALRDGGRERPPRKRKSRSSRTSRRSPSPSGTTTSAATPRRRRSWIRTASRRRAAEGRSSSGAESTRSCGTAD